jgi:ribosomal protein S18 acetylase RimI-like enzyme
MNIARLEDLSVIESIFAPFKKTYFPHIRQDYLKRKIDAGNVILEDGVVIVFAVYKRKQKIGTVEAQKGDAQIGQIVTATQGSGNASKILNKFFEEMNTDVWLTVRAENPRARAFYEKNGMLKVSDTSWSDGTIPGVVYKRSKNK